MLGVSKVGSDTQAGKEVDKTIIPTGSKAALERESIAAALCSEYLVAPKTIGRMLPQNVRKMMDTVVVLPEVLTVTCTRRDIDDGSGDGFQPWSAIEKDGPKAGWGNFWSDAFASGIGRAKAVLHLVYGLQPLTPNSQNVLLEFESDTLEPTPRVVARDVLDMKFHSD